MSMRVTNTHMLNQEPEQEDECDLMSQYVREQFTDEVDPDSSGLTAVASLSAQRRNKNTPFKKLSVRQLSHSYLLTDIHAMTQGRTAAERANTSHLISAAAHQHSASQGDNGAL